MEVEKTELDRQVDKLLEKEKNCRTLNDHLGSATVLKEIATLYYKADQLDTMCDIIRSLMGKRGQAKKAQIELVQLVMSWLPSVKDNDQRMRIVETVREVSDKKIFLEVEYARAVLMIVQNKEDANNISDAAKILQEVQVETYGSMSRREKL
jgi:26S proteasome regulatory subunit N5